MGDTQNFDASVDRMLSNYGDSKSIFSKVIGREMSHSSSANCYSRCWIYFASNAARTEVQSSVYLGILAVNTSVEVNILGTPDTRIRRPADVHHLSAPDHVFCEAIAVGMSSTRSNLDYSYKTDFQNWI